MKRTRRFRCRAEAIPAARRFARDVLADHAREVCEAAELMVSELATNCVRHARTGFELTIDASAIRVEVRDTGAGQPTVLHPSPREPSGRGLQIVQAMADAWGIVPAAGGKTVWFTLRPDPRLHS